MFVDFVGPSRLLAHYGPPSTLVSNRIKLNSNVSHLQPLTLHRHLRLLSLVAWIMLFS